MGITQCCTVAAFLRLPDSTGLQPAPPGLLSWSGERWQTSIPGEVYEVNDDTLEALDVLEGYPRFYDRELIDTPYGAAWVYVYLGSIDERPVIEAW